MLGYTPALKYLHFLIEVILQSGSCEKSDQCFLLRTHREWRLISIAGAAALESHVLVNLFFEHCVGVPLLRTLDPLRR